MLPVLLAKIGLPLLVDAVSSALGSVDHPAAQAASSALGEVATAIKGNDITPEQVAEANRHVERMTELDVDEAKHVISEVAATMRAETASEDSYVRRWRPTFGYAVALTWTAQMLAVSAVIVIDPAGSVAIVNALVNTSPIWGVALGVLGVAVVKRSQDKANGVPVATAPGGVAGLIQKALGR